MKRLWYFLSNLSSGITVLQAATPAGSVVAAALVAVWAHATKWGYFPVFLSAIATFTMTLWSTIGLVWLQKNSNRAHNLSIPMHDCSYGIAIENFSFVRNDQNNEYHLQLGFFIRNVLPFPVAYDVVEAFVKLVDKVPKESNKPFTTSGVLVRAGATRWQLAAFSKVFDPATSRLDGKVRLEILYGHPRLGLTKKRSYSCDIVVEYGYPSNNIVDLEPATPVLRVHVVEQQQQANYYAQTGLSNIREKDVDLPNALPFAD